ncbi:TM2 domain-containing protein [Pontibacter roseus]|uniref:TM2 domain-containing protein n=1 Tax=Pontibacter roseus TaxID=336989 RepID=UPI000375D5F7|nr:TM2 domain-containing protein [Pontibacter roseus]
MPNVFNIMPELEPDEMSFIQGIFNGLSDQEAQQFATIYRARRRDPLLVLVTAAVGFFGVAGVHRFILGSIGMGILYLFTGGLCFIGTIIDIINYKRLAFEYNIKEAQRVQAMMTGQYGGMNGYGM